MSKTEELAVPAPAASQQARILVADDQADVREALRLLLKAEGFLTETVNNPAAALEALQTDEFDVVLMDLNYQRDTTSGHEGIDLLSRVQALDACSTDLKKPGRDAASNPRSLAPSYRAPRRSCDRSPREAGRAGPLRVPTRKRPRR